MRLDIYLVNSGLCETRSKAKAAVLNSSIKVNGTTNNKPNYNVKKSDHVELTSTPQYVSRGAYKLLEAIQTWNLDFTSSVILDIGASTGGFTEIALINGAKRVYALDVGTKQLHHSLLTNPNVIAIEQTNFKDININMFKNKINYILADVSFISLTKLITKITEVFNYSYKCIFLIKPEFELSPKDINKNGMVKNLGLLKKAVNKIKLFAESKHFKVLGIIESPIKGNKAGNTEFLIYLEKP